jgi:hypothetical protein
VFLLRKLRDVFYINAYPENNEIVYYGMPLNEFLKYSPIELNKLLLLQSGFFGTDLSPNTKLEVVSKEIMEDFLKEDINSYGNFCWVDFKERDSIEKLEPLEVAELLYLGHMYRPVKSPFFNRLGNRYAYLSHDDGWFCRLYCMNYGDFQNIIANKIIDMASSSKRRKIYPLQYEIKALLLTLAENGLLIDFSNILINDKTIQIPIYSIGKFLNMGSRYD